MDQIQQKIHLERKRPLMNKLGKYSKIIKMKNIRLKKMKDLIQMVKVPFPKEKQIYQFYQQNKKLCLSKKVHFNKMTKLLNCVKMSIVIQF